MVRNSGTQQAIVIKLEPRTVHFGRKSGQSNIVSEQEVTSAENGLLVYAIGMKLFDRV